MTGLPTIEDLDVARKTVLVRLDLNVPMQAGRVLDATRLQRALPTIQTLIGKGAKVVVLSHFGRPDGKFTPSMSLAPLVDALSEAMWDKPVRFSPDCVGDTARRAVENTAYGEVILMENLRFHAEEEANDAAFGKALASLGDAFVNDAFSCSHRAHASIVGINPHIPSAAGTLMQEEVAMLASLFTQPDRPLVAVVGGSKISSKLELLSNLVEKVNHLIIGGAMAHSFIVAGGGKVGASLYEKDMIGTAKDIITKAKQQGCELHLPTDLVVAQALKAGAQCQIVEAAQVPADMSALDVGPETLGQWQQVISQSKTLVWNGPLGAFETAPFDASTIMLARWVAKCTARGALRSVAGGGDTVAALTHAGLRDGFSYLSTAGGAFLEWMEGKELPGVVALRQRVTRDAPRRRTHA